MLYEEGEGNRYGGAPGAYALFVKLGGTRDTEWDNEYISNHQNQTSGSDKSQAKISPPPYTTHTHTHTHTQTHKTRH